MQQDLDNQAARMRVDYSDDGLEATLVLAGRADPSIHTEAIMDELNESGVVFGVDRAAIERVLKSYRADTTLSEHRALIARGEAPTPGVDGRIEILVQEPEKVHLEEDGRADFRNVDRFKTVEQGEVLARLIPPEEGRPGISIFGQEVPAPEPKRPELETGPNVSEVPGSNQYIARVKGIFVRGKDRIDVNPVLEVPRNVGLESGNINYDGNVRIGGNIERGASVSAYGDVDVGGIIESGQIRTGGSLRARKGINTRKEDKVTVGGELHATYIDNTAAVVEGSVFVDRSIVQSRIVCYGDVSLALPGATVTGGDLIVFGSVVVGVLGNKTETPTRLWIGAHYKNMEYYKLSIKELEKAERELARKTSVVEKIKVFVQRSRGNIPPEKKSEFRIQFREYQEAVALVQRIQQQMKEYAQNRWNREEVRLIVREIMYPGVEIHFHGNVEKIRAPQTKVILRFQAGMEKPIMEGYRPKEI